MMKRLWMALGLVCALGADLRGQWVPPALFSEMDGLHFLDDGTALPIWGYGWTTDGYISLPGPLLEYTQGADVVLAFENPSPESHTIHLHGLDVDQANDGVPATSFYVETGESTSYEFNATHTGTYLFHCHVTTTLHLTMCMYGMVLVTRPDGALFENGPVMSQEVPLLFSDLEVATNLDPVGSFPFHDMRPDVFMVNGKSGGQLADEVVWTSENGPTALRLGSMAYSRITCHFPAGLNAQLWMSDGREVPATALDSLEIYPGERFTVLVEPDAGFDGGMEVEFWHMVDAQLESVQVVPIRDEALHPSQVLQHEPDLQMYPNPAREELTLPLTGKETLTVWGANGRVVFSGPVEGGVLHVSDWTNGVYTAKWGGQPITRFVVAH